MKYKRIFFMVITFLGFTSAGWSVTPYLGGAFQCDLVLPHRGTINQWHHEYGCFGSEWVVGLSWPMWSVYAGYHATTSEEYRQYEYLLTTSLWRERRGILGTRCYLNGKSTYPIKPTIGFALTYGQTKMKIAGFFNPGNRYALSSENYGAMTEFGMMIRTQQRIDISIMAQVHYFEPRFHNSYDASVFDNYKVIMPSWQIGMQYRLPEIH